MMEGNELLRELIDKNWEPMLVAYCIIRSMFPDNRLLRVIGEVFSSRFPIFKRNS